MLHKQLAEFTLLDAARTRDEDPPDDAGEVTSGYDDDFHEVVVFTQNGKRVEARKDTPSIFVACNVVTESWDALRQLTAGNSPTSKIEIVIHRRTLECLDLIDCDTGQAKIRVNDKLISIRDRCKRMAYKPQFPLYVVEVAPIFGIGETPDLIQITCEDRERFATG